MIKPAHLTALIGGAVVLIALTGGTAAYITQQTIENSADRPRAEKIVIRETAPVQRVQAQAPACDDGNIVGHALGGVAGGVVGSQVGSGSGQTAATIAGTLGGAYLGGEHIPTRNVTCP